MCPLRRLLVMVAVLAVAGCTITHSSVTPSPSTAPLSSPAVLSSTPSLTAPGASTVGEATFGAALDAAMAELMAAIGNPDTGAPSEASTAFDNALASGDAPAITSTADAILDHLAAGRDAIAQVAGYQPGAEMCHEWELMFAGIAESITAMRDGGLEGSESAVAAGRTRMGEVLQDHFWPAVRGSSPDTYRTFFPDGRSATASRMRWSTPVNLAFDGSDSSAWTAGGAAPPQWIEVDLGWEAAIVGIRLLTFQDIQGASDHRVTVRSANGPEQELVRFTGTTTDRHWLEYAAPMPVQGAQIVRVTTLSTPGMVGWREFKVIVAPGSMPSACLSGSDDLTVGADVMGEPSLPGHEPALAIDGEASTSWDPGETRGPGNVRGWIRVILAHDAFVAEVRLLLGQPAGEEAEYGVTGWPSSGQSMLLGKVSGTTKDGEWLSVAGPTPCHALRSVDVAVVSEAPAAVVREIQVLGTVAR